MFGARDLNIKMLQKNKHIIKYTGVYMFTIHDDGNHWNKTVDTWSFAMI